MSSVGQFWYLARRLPLTACLLVLTMAACGVGLAIGLPKVENYVNPSAFSNLSGDYVGDFPDGGVFHLCFAAFGPKVLGEMTPEGGAAQIDYWGVVDKDRNQLVLHYTQADSRKPDHGDAFLSPIGKNDLQGYYQSIVYPDRRQALTLERTGQACELKQFELGW